MGKYIGAVCRLCRAEGSKLFLKGRRCLTDKCAVEKKAYPPGQKGKKINFKKSNYKTQLREKQKVKRFYGLGEKQFRNFFARASQQKGITGENLLKSMEMRLDNIIYRMNFAASRRQCRQLLKHGHFLVNGKKVTIPSYIIALNDEITVKEKSLKSEKFKALMETISGLVEIPDWLTVDKEKYAGKVNRLPTREDVSLAVEEHLIVELYSK